MEFESFGRLGPIGDILECSTVPGNMGSRVMGSTEKMNEKQDI